MAEIEPSKPSFTVRWRAVEDSHLVWRQWEEDAHGDADPLWVAYFLDSDDTHLMNDLGAEIIHALQKQPLSLEELLDVLARDFLPSPELRSAVPRSLIERFIRRMILSGMIYETEEKE